MSVEGRGRPVNWHAEKITASADDKPRGKGSSPCGPVGGKGKEEGDIKLSLGRKKKCPKVVAGNVPGTGRKGGKKKKRVTIAEKEHLACREEAPSISSQGRKGGKKGFCRRKQKSSAGRERPRGEKKKTRSPTKKKKDEGDLVPEGQAPHLKRKREVPFAKKGSGFGSKRSQLAGGKEGEKSRGSKKSEMPVCRKKKKNWPRKKGRSRKKVRCGHEAKDAALVRTGKRKKKRGGACR